MTDPASRAAAERAAVEWKRMAGASKHRASNRIEKKKKNQSEEREDS